MLQGLNIGGQRLLSPPRTAATDLRLRLLVAQRLVRAANAMPRLFWLGLNGWGLKEAPLLRCLLRLKHVTAMDVDGLLPLPTHPLASTQQQRPPQAAGPEGQRTAGSSSDDHGINNRMGDDVDHLAGLLRARLGDALKEPLPPAYKSSARMADRNLSRMMFDATID